MNTRQADRIEVNAAASFRRGAGLAIAVGVADLTPHGCRLIAIPRNLARSEMISLRIAGVGPLLAHVRWLRLGREAGLEFDRPLDPRLHAIIVGENRLTPADPYRAEIMELRNRFHDDGGSAPAHDPDRDPASVAAGGDAPDPDPVDLRSAVRIAADNDPAMAVDVEEGAVQVRILDFSQHGLRIGHAGIRATAGSHLTLVFPDNQIVTGEVRWNDGTALGLAVRVNEREVFAANDGALPEPVPAAPWPEADFVPERSFAKPEEVTVEPVAVTAPVASLEPEPEPEAEPEPEPLPEPGPDPDTLARFEALLTAARALDFVSATVRADNQGLTIHLALRDPA